LEWPKGEQEFLIDDVLATVRRLNANGLNVIVDLQPRPHSRTYGTTDLLIPRFEGHAKPFRELIGRIATKLSAMDQRKVALELINEPLQGCNGHDVDALNAALSSLYRYARAAAPALTLLVDGGCENTIDGLVELQPSAFQRDPNVIYSFHFYEPYMFTLGAEDASTMPEFIPLQLPYPARTDMKSAALASMENYYSTHAATADSNSDLEGRSEKLINKYFDYAPDARWISGRFDAVARWAAKEGIPAGQIQLGEFGVPVRAADVARIASEGDRLSWIGDVRRAAEGHGFGWSFWEYPTQMSNAVNGSNRNLNPGVMKALGLNPTDTGR
jgi:hypothetical protein